MSPPAEEFYTEERWQNWLDRLREADLEPDDEESARLLLNLQDDVAIAVAKILKSFEDDEVEVDEAVDELVAIHELVSDEPAFDDEDTAIMLGGVQIGLHCVFAAAERYLTEWVASEATVEEYLHSASAAEAEEDYERALGLAAAAGTRVIDGDGLDTSIVDELEWHVTEWVTGLDSLRNALTDPEVVEE